MRPAIQTELGLRSGEDQEGFEIVRLMLEHRLGDRRGLLHPPPDEQ